MYRRIWKWSISFYRGCVRGTWRYSARGAQPVFTGLEPVLCICFTCIQFRRVVASWVNGHNTLVGKNLSCLSIYYMRLYECDAWATLRHFFLGLGRLDPEDDREPKAR
jgi:hypothetical protein